MSTSLTVTKTLSDTGWTVTASLNIGAAIPRDIFVYHNTGTTQLGTYYGVLNVLDLNRISIWTGSALPLFGNNFVRYNSATILVGQTSDVDDVIAKLDASVQTFSTKFQAISPSTQVFNIT